MASETEKQLTYGMTADLYRAAIGTRGVDYYLRQFVKFDAQGKTSASWHWPAYWSTLNWLIYRKMWGWALAYIAALAALTMVVFGVGKLVFNYSDTTGVLLFLMLLTVAFVLPGLYANAWFYTYCNEKISAVLRETPEVKDACEVLAAQASTKRRWFGLALVNVAVLALAAGVASFVLGLDQGGGLLAQIQAGKPASSESTREAPAVVAATAMAPTDPKPPAVPAPQLTLAPAGPAPEVLGLTSAAKIEALVSKSEPAVEKVADKVAEAMAGKTADAPPAPVADNKLMPAAPMLVAAASADKPAASLPQPAVAKRAKSEASPAVAVAQAKPAPAPEKAETPSAKTAKVKRQWFVQAGAFSRENNAQTVRAKIEAAGMQTSAEPSDTPAGRLIRVRVGPFDTKAEAEKAALQVKSLELPAVLFRE